MVLLAVGCGDDDDASSSPTPFATATAAPISTATRVASSTPAASATAAPSTTATAAPTNAPSASPTVVAGALAIPAEVAEHARDWPLPNRDYGNTRATTDSTINAGNVTELAVAWRAPIPTSGVFGNLATNPLILGDTVYVQSLSSDVFAIDFADGTVRWRRALTGVNPGPNGVALGYGRVFAATGDGRVVALDAGDGAVLWTMSLTRTATEGIDIQPIVIDGKVYISTVPVSIGGQFRGGDRGVIHALDAESGAVVWSFDTVESDDLWAHPDINSGGGAWYPPAVDPTSGAMYWGIGNAAPFPGNAEFPNGTSRPGSNLYMTSTVALSARDGRLLWHHQVKPHDLFDHDFQLALFAELPLGGVAQPTVIGTGKTGTVHSFDPANGDERWQAEVGEHFNDDLTELPLGEEVLVSPGLFGGVLTPPAVADGIIYIPVVEMPSTYEADFTDPFSFNEFIATATGEIVAVDGDGGTVLWTRPFLSPVFGGATVVNDLVFTSTFDGTIYALRRSDGEILWSDATQRPINGWPAVAGDTIIFPIGGGAPGEVVAYR